MKYTTGMRELRQAERQDQPQATPQDQPSPLPDGTDEAALLREFLIGDTDLMLLADNHLLHIRQLIAWVDSEPVQKILADMERIAEIRTNAILAQAKSAAATRLAQSATQDPDRIPPKQIAAHESARKAASQLLRPISSIAIRHSSLAPAPQRASRMPTPESPVPSPECPVPIAECPVPSAESRVPNAECPVPIAECRIPSAQSRIPNPPLCHSPFATRHSPLAIRPTPASLTPQTNPPSPRLSAALRGECLNASPVHSSSPCPPFLALSLSRSLAHCPLPSSPHSLNRSPPPPLSLRPFPTPDVSQILAEHPPARPIIR